MTSVPLQNCDGVLVCSGSGSDVLSSFFSKSEGSGWTGRVAATGMDLGVVERREGGGERMWIRWRWIDGGVVGDLERYRDSE